MNGSKLKKKKKKLKNFKVFPHTVVSYNQIVLIDTVIYNYSMTSLLKMNAIENEYYFPI